MKENSGKQKFSIPLLIPLLGKCRGVFLNPEVIKISKAADAVMNDADGTLNELLTMYECSR